MPSPFAATERYSLRIMILPRLKIAAVSFALAGTAHAGPFFSPFLERAPTISAVVPVPYQTAHRNIGAGLRFCATSDPIVTGTVYTDERFGDLFAWQRGTDNPLLSYIEIRAIDANSSRIEAWHVKPTFGEGLTQFAKAAPPLAVMGAKSNCEALGF